MHPEDDAKIGNGASITRRRFVAGVLAVGASGLIPSDEARDLAEAASPFRGSVVVATARSAPEDPEVGLGLRVARRLDDRTVRLTFGASFVPKVGGRPETYRIMCETDPRFQPGIRADGAKVQSEDDPATPKGWSGRPYPRNSVVIHLPAPMTAGHRYWVQALGYDHQPVTGGRAAAWIETMTDAVEQKDANRNSLGLRSLEYLAPTVLLATTGDGLDLKRLDPDIIRLESTDDSAFLKGRAPSHIGRRSRGDCLYTDGWPYGIFRKHELFLVFDEALKPGKHYHLRMNHAVPLVIGVSEAEIALDQARAINPALKVNQVGYLPDAPKYAYLGEWMGSLGALDYSPFAKEFSVRHSDTGRAVMSGSCRLRHRAGDRAESVYHADLSGEDVYEMDFSALTSPGDYYLEVAGCGRSLPFRIAFDVYDGPFAVMMNGLLDQRCGIELRTPIAQCYRPVCHRHRTQLTDLPRGSEANAFAELPHHVTDPKKYDLWGGYHDAGDFDPRSHIEIAETLLLLYEMRPHSFWDGQSKIPERRNGLPDILDAAAWELSLWGRLQDESGAVRGGIEENGDPDQITPAEEDSLREFAFAPDVKASLRFAAAAAQAAILWKQLARTDESATFSSRARRAWNWATKQDSHANADDVALAAIQLYRLTGDPEYLQAFDNASVFRTLPNPALAEYNKYDQQDASFYYAFCKRPVDKALRKKIVDSFRSMANGWITAAETTAYRYAHNPYAPNTWGTGGLPIGLIPLAQAFVLTGTSEFRRWIQITCDFSLGCNPMNTVFTTRLGQRPIWRPLHLFSRYCPDAPLAGVQCEGPSPRTGGVPATSSMGSWVDQSLFPDGPWPELQTYCDLFMIPEMNEGVVVNQVHTAFAYGFLLPDRRPALTTRR